MRIFLLPSEFHGERSIDLKGKDYRYLIKVLRFTEGSVFRGRDGSGNIYSLLVSRIDHAARVCTLSVSSVETFEHDASNPMPAESSLPDITLYQCVLKGKKMDTLLRQCVEIGIRRFSPIQSDHTVPDIISKDTAKRLQRWNSIRDEALQQSGSPVMTEIEHPMTIDQMISQWDTDSLGIFFHQEPLSPQSLEETISSYAEQTGSDDFPVSLVIGPEGGLSDREVSELKKAGMRPAFLKTNILRAETAAVYAAACTQMLLTGLPTGRSRER